MSPKPKGVVDGGETPAADRISKTQRWLDLIALLLGRKLPIPVEEIMMRVPAYAQGWEKGGERARASARRSFERDKDELRAAGIPIETLAYSFDGEELEGYRITRSDFYLPYLRILSEPGDLALPQGALPPGVPRLDLAPAEAELAMQALHRVAGLPAFPFADDARSALRKLAFDVDPDRFPEDPVVWVERPGTREVLERLRVLSDALLARKRVSFLYHGIARGEVTERTVAPFGLFFQRDWYLVGHAVVRDDIRVFRVARMETVRPNTASPKQPDFVVPADFQLRNYLDRSAWELGEPGEAVDVTVRFHSPLPACDQQYRVSRRDPFLRWLLSCAGEAEILEPVALRDELRGMAREVAALYAQEGEETSTHG